MGIAYFADLKLYSTRVWLVLVVVIAEPRLAIIDPQLEPSRICLSGRVWEKGEVIDLVFLANERRPDLPQGLPYGAEVCAEALDLAVEPGSHGARALGEAAVGGPPRGGRGWSARRGGWRGPGACPPRCRGRPPRLGGGGARGPGSGPSCA